MKNFVNGIIVVEGSNDASYLSSFIDAEIVSINGLELHNIKYLKKAQKFKTIYLLIDPDKEGLNIRERIKEQIKNCIDLHIDISKCTKGDKKGIFECEKDEIIFAISPYFEKRINDKLEKKTIQFDRKTRENICKKIDIENCNNKTFNQRLETLNIDVNNLK